MYIFNEEPYVTKWFTEVSSIKIKQSKSRKNELETDINVSIDKNKTRKY